MKETVNDKLLKEQIYWVGTVLRNYIKEDNPKFIYDGDSKSRQKKGQILSHPFYMGLSDKYLDCKNGKRIMVVGREAMGYGKICDGTAKYDFIKSCTSKKCEEGKNEPHNSQEWAIAYLDKQVYKIDIKLPDCYQEKINNNTSSFWNFFRWLNNVGFVPCWNNVDKVYFETTLSEKAEEVLSSPYDKDSKYKSLLQREIELCEPNIVLFVTGATYYKSVFTALNLNGEQIPKPVPEKNKKCLVKLPDIEGVHCYWSDHPRGLTAKGFNKQDILHYIINELK